MRCVVRRREGEEKATHCPEEGGREQRRERALWRLRTLQSHQSEGDWEWSHQLNWEEPMESLNDLHWRRRRRKRNRVVRNEATPTADT